MDLIFWEVKGFGEFEFVRRLSFVYKNFIRDLGWEIIFSLFFF